MRIKLFLFSVLFLTFALIHEAAGLAYADEGDPAVSMTDFAASTHMTPKVLDQALEQPLTLNKELNTVIISDSAWKFLKDLNLNISTFTTSDGTQSVGIRYTLTKDVSRKYFTAENVLQTGLAYSVNLDGNISLEQNVNPDDFLNTNFSIHYFRSQGGAVQATDELYTTLNQLESQMAAIEDQSELLTSSEFKAFSAALRKNLSDQYYIDFSTLGGFVSNQSFSEKQFYYGVQLGLDLKAWNPDSRLAKYNIVDWPFALIRYLSDSDSAFTPRGSAIPTLLLGVDMVDPMTGVVKKLHEDDSFFTRLRAETSFRTPLSLNNSIFFEASYRYYWEPGASQLVKKTAMDKFGYFVAALTMPGGLFVSYSTGKLPSDLESDRVYELGFKFNL